MSGGPLRRVARWLAFAALLPAPALGQTSDHTPLAGPRCGALAGPRFDGPGGPRECPGPFGHVLRLEEGDGGEALILRPPGGPETRVIPPRGPYHPGPSTIGSPVEWRVGNGVAHRLIARRRLADGRTWHEVHKIEGTRLCWIANVRAEDGGERQARRLADTYRDLPCP